MSDVIEAARREAAMVWAMRPTEGTDRELRAWSNGFREALEAVDDALGSSLALLICGGSA